jgi:hypothetical protein
VPGGEISAVVDPNLAAGILGGRLERYDLAGA